MLQKEHELLLDLIVEYYNRREDWMENNTRVSAIEYRKTLKKIVACARDMMDGIQEVQRERRKENLRIFHEKGFVPKKAKPKERPTKRTDD